MAKDVSKFVVNGETINVKDTTARNNANLAIQQNSALTGKVGNLEINLNGIGGDVLELEKQMELRNPYPINGGIYVDSVHGSDSNNGITAETAFATIQKAVNYAQEHYCVPRNLASIYIASGNYYENVMIGGEGFGYSYLFILRTGDVHIYGSISVIDSHVRFTAIRQAWILHVHEYNTSSAWGYNELFLSTLSKIYIDCKMVLDVTSGNVSKVMDINYTDIMTMAYTDITMTGSADYPVFAVYCDVRLSLKDGAFSTRNATYSAHYCTIFDGNTSIAHTIENTYSLYTGANLTLKT